MIEAVVFDCDGLLVDTETPWYEAFRDIYREHGADLPLEKYVRCVGTDFRFFDPYAYLEECTGKTFAREALSKKLARRHEQKMKAVSLRPGVQQYLTDAKQIGLKIGLASSSPRHWVLMYIERFGIAHYFDVVCTADDVREIKPDPELYLQACSKLGVTPKRAIAFED